MKYETRQDALKAGIAVRDRLTSTGWTVDVWENVGWHWALHKGLWTLIPTGVDGRMCYPLLADSSRSAGSGAIVWSMNGESFLDPNDAVRAQLARAKEHATKMADAVADAVRQATT